MSYTVRPLSDHTWLRPQFKRTVTRFSASWAETEHQLLDEVDRLSGRNLVIEVDVREQDLRVDGRIRAKAHATSPAVVIAFETTAHGPMLYRCDTFTTAYADQGPAWQHNVRAIAKTLEALRAVDRYGATETGQQYTGFKALPGGTPMPAGPERMTEADAGEVIRGYGGSYNTLRESYRAALRATHPDHGGRREDFDRLQQAARVAGLAR
jgi:hypothetical protein